MLTLFADTKLTTIAKATKKTYISLDNITLTPTAYEAWRQTEYLERQKMRNRFEDLQFEEYTEPQLCIIEDAETKEKFYVVFVAARNFITRLQIEESDWCLSKVEEDAIGSYYKDSIHNFKVFAKTKEDAHYRIYKECAKNGLLVPTMKQIENL